MKTRVLDVNTQGQLEYLLKTCRDHKAFEYLCTALLGCEEEYKGIQACGGVDDKGIDAKIHDGGRVIYFQYSTRKDWKKKLRDEMSNVCRWNVKPVLYVYVTNQDVDYRVKETIVRDLVDKNELSQMEILDYSWLYPKLLANESICKEFFNKCEGEGFSWERYGEYAHNETDRMQLSKLYVQPKAHDDREAQSFDLVGRCCDRLSTNTRRIAILGDFGTGKTAFTVWLLDYLLNHRSEVSCQFQRVIRAELRGYEKGDDLLAFLGRELSRGTWFTPSIKEVRGYICAPDTLLILDGLDEMSRFRCGNPRDELRHNLRDIVSLSNECNLILTSRHEYFRDDQTEYSLRQHGFEIFYLTTWGDDEVRQYFDLCDKAGLLKNDLAAILSKLSRTFDLPDILRRPLFAGMLISGEVGIELESEKPIKVTSVYKDYLKEWVKKQANQRARALDIERKIYYFLEELAFKMTVDDVRSIHFSEIDKMMAPIFTEHTGYSQGLLSDELSVLAQDARSNTVLRREGEDTFCFGHQSFLEYFVAKKIVDHLMRDDAQPIREIDSRPGLLYFAWQIFAEKCDSSEVLNGLISKEENHRALAFLLDLRREVCENDPDLAAMFQSGFNEESKTLSKPRDSSPYVFIPSGYFIFGSNEHSDESPPQRIHLSDFLIGEKPVSNADFVEFLKSTKYKPSEQDIEFFFDCAQCYPDDPVTFVSWIDAASFAKWRGVRLPSDKEWEKAARGCIGRRWPWGDVFETIFEKGNSEYSSLSPYGIFHSAGGVWEWTCTPGSKSEPDQQPNDREYVTKGGSSDEPAHRLRCASRQVEHASNVFSNLGFRIAKDFS